MSCLLLRTVTFRKTVPLRGSMSHNSMGKESCFACFVFDAPTLVGSNILSFSSTENMLSAIGERRFCSSGDSWRNPDVPATLWLSKLTRFSVKTFSFFDSGLMSRLLVASGLSLSGCVVLWTSSDFDWNGRLRAVVGLWFRSVRLSSFGLFGAF